MSQPFVTPRASGCRGALPLMSIFLPAELAACSSVSLTWNTSTLAVVGYNVYRGT